MSNKTIVLREAVDDDYRDDCERICRVLRKRGYSCDVATAKKLWQRYSGSMAAGWLFLDSYDDEALASVVLAELEEGEVQDDNGDAPVCERCKRSIDPSYFCDVSGLCGDCHEEQER